MSPTNDDRFHYRPRVVPGRSMTDGLAEVERQAQAAGALAVFRALQNTLVMAFDDVAIGADDKLTFFGRPNNASYVPLVKVHVTGGGIDLELDPPLVLRTLGIAQSAVEEFLSVLPGARTEVERPTGPRLLVTVDDPADVRAVADFLMRRFGGSGQR